MDIYRHYGPALLRKCHRMLGSGEDAEDVVQQLFIDLIRKERTDVDLPYLYRAATHRCLNRIRDRGRRAALLALHGPAVLPQQTGSMEGQVSSAELVRRLVDELDALGDGSVEILVYRFVDELELSEIADLVGLSRKTVSKRLRRLQHRLESLMAMPPGGAP